MTPSPDSTIAITKGNQIPLRKLLSGSFLIAGTSVGAGMLGIPAVTIESGFAPGLLISALVWGFMLVTGLLLLEVTLKMPAGSNILSITKTHLGKTGSNIAGGMFAFLYYCLIVAYIAGGSPLFYGFFSSAGLNSLPPFMQYVVFTGIISSIVYLGVRWVDRINIVLSFLMIGSFALLFINGCSEISPTKLAATTAYSKMHLAVPILFGAFGYHNIVPTLCDYLERDRKTLRLSLVFGTLLAMTFYSVWQYLIIGSVDPAYLKKLVFEGKTVIAALEGVTHSPALFIFGKWFGLFALITSVLGVSLSMVDFFRDGFKVLLKKDSRLPSCIITFIPPLIFTMLNPDIFTKALGLAGGIGEATINGLIPVALFWAYRYAKGQTDAKETLHKSGLCFLFTLGIAVMVIEIIALRG